MPPSVNFKRDGEAGAQIALAIAAGDGIDGEHHDADAGALGAGHHRPVEAAVLVEIELVDLRERMVLRQFLEADRAEGRDAEHGAELLDRARHRALAVIVEQPLQRRRRAVERHREFLAQHGDRQIDVGDAGEHARHQVAVLEGRGVAPVGGLVVGGAVDVVEDRPRQALLRQAAEVVEIEALVQPHVVLTPPWRADDRRGDRDRRSRHRSHRARPCRRHRPASSYWRSRLPGSPRCAACDAPRNA